MCGITGVYNFNGSPVPVELIKKMNACIKHRGPDSSGYYSRGHVALGNRRLSILDLSSLGTQPMSDDENKVALTYNGEIYNFKKIRSDLLHLGYVFKTNTDTEVVLKAYLEWGISCVKKFNGMFAFAIFDQRKNNIFLARDRYGIKPLYYWNNARSFLFASEIKSMMQYPGFHAEVDESSLTQYFSFQNILDDGTLFKGVKLLPQGSYIILDINQHNPPRYVKYWEPDFKADAGLENTVEVADELEKLFTQAVNKQLVSDVPIATFLSGGIDSGSVTSVASKSISELPTYTAGFDVTDVTQQEKHFDERENARFLAERFGTQHNEIEIRHEDMENCLETLIRHLEDLRVGQSYPKYKLYEATARNVKVALSGTGCDELLAGYPWRYRYAIDAHDASDYESHYSNYWRRTMPNNLLEKVFVKKSNHQYFRDESEQIFKNAFNPTGTELVTKEDFVNQSLEFEFRTFLHGLLIVDDKLSMAHSLEVRVPFLDNDLVNFALKIPVHMKLNNFFSSPPSIKNTSDPTGMNNRTNEGKEILRTVLSSYMPNEYTKQNKQGFSGPDATWFRRESLPFIEKLLLDQNSRISQYVRREFTSDVLQQHRSVKYNHRLLIWSLLSFEMWLRNFIK